MSLGTRKPYFMFPTVLAVVSILGFKVELVFASINTALIGLRWCAVCAFLLLHKPVFFGLLHKPVFFGTDFYHINHHIGRD